MGRRGVVKVGNDAGKRERGFPLGFPNQVQSEVSPPPPPSHQT